MADVMDVRTCIKVCSNDNPWIDFCIVLENEKDVMEANETIEQAYEEWFSSDNATDLPIADYISDKLSDVCIEHEIYFTGKEEEDYE